jgi:hypothetical protein
MPKLIESGNRISILSGAATAKSLSRKNFIRYSTAATIIAVGISACHKDHNHDNNNNIGNNGNNDEEFDFGSGDNGLLNYVYALEQLQAAFYAKLIMTPYSGMSASETALLTDIRDHEIVHRELLKAVLGTNAIKALTPDFSSIDFSSRTSVLTAAKTLKDLGVSAYNGAGMLMYNGDSVILAAKIVSVEARHSAYIHNLLSNGSFADNIVVDSMGLDKANQPGTVITVINNYLKTKISGKNLPTS